MLAAKSILVAAAAAFAVAQAASPSHVKVSVHHVKQDVKCQPGFSPVSVEGVKGVFCAKDKICVADVADGNCPTDVAEGMPYGAYCGKVKTGVYGCLPKTEADDDDDSEDSEECGEGESPMSVEGVEGVFCVAGKACVADIKDGACPGKQEGLPYGSSCGKVKTGVYGCKPNAAPAAHKHKSVNAKAGKCGNGFSEVSVEGVPGVYCAKDQICVANIQGNCPDFAECGRVKTGVLGCKPKKHFAKSMTAKAGKCGNGFSEVSVEGVPGVYCAKDQICVANIQGNCPDFAECGRVKTGVLGCKPKKHLMLKNYTKQQKKCPAGSTEVSVEGVEGVFCAKDKICVADVADGNCPTESAPGMPYGAYCGKVKTGVYGCLPKTEADDDDDDSEDSEECGEGESPMSVEGVEGVFCVAGKACVADIKDGACPGKQEGLPYGSSCGKVKTGVYGCKPNAAPGLRKHKNN